LLDVSLPVVAPCRGGRSGLTRPASRRQTSLKTVHNAWFRFAGPNCSVVNEPPTCTTQDSGESLFIVIIGLLVHHNPWGMRSGRVQG
jgi:hypothetical protein